MAKDLVRFHRSVLGWTSPPPEYKLTPRQERLYLAYHSGARGYDYTGQDEELYIATFILALQQTDPTSLVEQRRVILAVAPTLMPWALDVTKRICQHILRSRHHSVTSAQIMRKAITQVAMGSKVLQIPHPDFWAAYGFGGTMPLASWMTTGTLIKI